MKVYLNGKKENTKAAGLNKVVSEVKRTPPHCDVSYNKKDNKPRQNANSQVPGTHVAIWSFGDNRLLQFEKWGEMLM